MFQWDAVDTSPDWGGGQNVLKTIETAIRHNRRTTQTDLESFLSLDLFSPTLQNIFGPLTGGGGDRPHRPPMDSPLSYEVHKARAQQLPGWLTVAFKD